MERKGGALLFDAEEIELLPNLKPSLPEAYARDTLNTVGQEMEECKSEAIELGMSPRVSDKGRSLDLWKRFGLLCRMADQLTGVVNEQEIVAGFEKFLQNQGS